MKKVAAEPVPQCEDQLFKLTPLHHGLHFSQPISLSFCNVQMQAKTKPISNKRRTKQVAKKCGLWPIFNKDQNYATDSFILADEKKNYMENGIKYKIEHECRIREYNCEKTQLLVPKPKYKQAYCNVCRSTCDDYLDHIQSPSHKISIKTAPFNRCIKELAEKYDEIGEGRNSSATNKYSSDTTQNVISDDMHMNMNINVSMNMQGLPIKMHKAESTYMMNPAFPHFLAHPHYTLVQETPITSFPIPFNNNCSGMLFNMPVLFYNPCQELGNIFQQFFASGL